MPVPLRYNLRSLFYRKTATLLTLVAIGLTVSVLMVLLAMNRGFRRSLAQTGRVDNYLCLRTGSVSEGESTIARDDANVIKGFSAITVGPDGKALVAAEMYAAISLEREGGGTTNIPLRGVAPESFKLRDGLHVAEGRTFSPGTREVVVGQALVGRIRGCRLGGTVRISKDQWEVVGVMSAGGTAFDSEIWGDAELLLQVFDRTFYNSVVFRGPPDADTRPLVERLGEIKVQTEQAYFAAQTGFLGAALMFAAVVLTLLMCFGALAGCTNTLLAAVAGRTREIGGLLAIGYRPWHIFVGFVVESLALSLLGGAVGILATAAIGSGFRMTMTNWDTFTEQAFNLSIDGSVILAALVLVVVVGLIGGVLPALRASRLRPVEALRRG